MMVLFCSVRAHPYFTHFAFSLYDVNGSLVLEKSELNQMTQRYLWRSLGGKQEGCDDFSEKLDYDGDGKIDLGDLLKMTVKKHALIPHVIYLIFNKGRNEAKVSRRQHVEKDCEEEGGAFWTHTFSGILDRLGRVPTTFKSGEEHNELRS